MAKHSPVFVPAHSGAETETAVWAMIVILLGIAAFAIFSLFGKVVS